MSIAGKQFNQFDGVEISGCTNSSFNKTTVIQEKADDYIVIIGDLSSSFTQESGLKLTRKVPDMDYICENGNRLWGCSSANHEVYASKLGDPTNWNAFEGISTDSYAATVGSDGDFTGCLSHMGYVLFFKEDTIHKVYGDKPSNFQINTSFPVRGVAKGCEKTACVVNETLLYVSRSNVCSFDGAYPESVSDALAEVRFQGGVAGQHNGKYYASLQDVSGQWNIYVYDLKKGMWHKEDDMQALFMAYGEGQLYCVDSTGKLFTISGSRDEQIEWMLESGDQLDESVEYKFLKRLLFNLNLDPGSEVDVFIKCDSEPEFEKKISFTSQGYRTQVLNITPARCQRYRFRLEGKGPAVLIAMSKYIVLQSFFIGITMRILSIIIFVIVYGRMIEIYCMVSLAPIPMATFGNHEQSHMGQNYLKCLFALGFQGFLILICVAIYAVLIQSVAISGDAINSICNDGNWHNYGSDEPDNIKKLLDDYDILQYGYYSDTDKEKLFGK